jgi:hypothetical protein
VLREQKLRIELRAHAPMQIKEAQNMWRNELSPVTLWASDNPGPSERHDGCRATSHGLELQRWMIPYCILCVFQAIFVHYL